MIFNKKLLFLQYCTWNKSYNIITTENNYVFGNKTKYVSQEDEYNLRSILI